MQVHSAPFGSDPAPEVRRQGYRRGPTLPRCDGGALAVASLAGLDGPQTTEVSVANIKSQIKRNRQNEKRRMRNRTVRSEINTRTKAALAATEYDDDETAAETLRLAVRRIDKAAAKGVIHKNTAARHKSRLIQEIQRRSESADASD